jgi:hypothetical protein
VADLDDSGTTHGPFVSEETVPVGAIVGLVVGLGVFGLGLHRWFGGDHRPADAWLVSSLLVGVFFSVLRAIRRFVVVRGWHRLYRALRIDPDEIGKTGVYRPPPDPRRTRRQRFIDLFSDDLDRSNDPLPQTRAGRVANAAGAILGLVLDLVFPLVPLLAVLFGFPAVDVAFFGGWWSVQCLRRLITLGRVPRRPGTTETAR